MRCVQALLVSVGLLPLPAFGQTEVTNPAIIENLQRRVEEGGYGCPRVVVAHRLSDDEYARTQFMVACSADGRGIFYRVTFPPTGRAIVAPWTR